VDDPRLTWYLARSSGLVAVVLLTLTLVLGVLATSPGTRRWPRAATQGIHRAATLGALLLIVVHVAALVADHWVTVRWYDALLPGGTTYRPLWVGLGAVSFDLLLVVIVTSLLRTRVPPRFWRTLHVTGYVAWLLAVSHGIAAGTDTRDPAVVATYAACTGAVAAAAMARVATARLTLTARLFAGSLLGATSAWLALWAVTGPLAP
jgi:sulfoxide reductase heme-binding subunit YedZ